MHAKRGRKTACSTFVTTKLLKIKRTLFPAYTLCATYSGVSQRIAFV
ncbi:hypothetical protein HMPREF9445_01049 [Bacteroides clarus YIT 12056]|uniref:Uncharacterized protein n=1 Tax=Bacteroides clarus YIT 12056 TaxID=762984 RepID=A0ABN0CQL8_9BACE|nr:hypothetical protein HMPREF9445_01049 [Bacteroides clarus YIT 12056]